MAALTSTMITASPGRRASHTRRTASGWPRSVRCPATGQVAAAAGTSIAATPPAPITTSSVAGSLRRAARVAQATAAVAQTSTNGRTTGTSLRSAHGWSGVIAGRQSTAAVDSPPTNSSGAQAGTGCPSRRPCRHRASARRVPSAAASSASTGVTGPRYQVSHWTLCSA